MPRARSRWVNAVVFSYAAGRGGTGNGVEVTGWEYRRFTGDGQVAESLSRFDAARDERQLAGC